MRYKHLQTRQIKRHTLYYYWLIHKALHPLTLDTNDFLNKNLHFYKKEITNYEKKKILKGDVPIFYHSLKSYDLYGEKNLITSKNDTKINSFDWYIQKQKSILKGKPFLKERIKEISKLIAS